MEEMTEQHCVVIGASHAGVSLVMQLRKEGWDGRISLVGTERETPYQRPPLSKDYLAGGKGLQEIRLRPREMFAANKIDLYLGFTALRVDPSENIVTLSDGQKLKYHKLALCTGSIVKTIPVGEPLENIFYIRTAEEVSRIISMLESGKRAVIIGAGYIGLETAAVLNRMGLRVTVVEQSKRVLQRITCKEMSTYIQSLHLQEGVEFLTSTKVESIEGTKKVEKVICQDGTILPADLVIVGVGVGPNIGLAKEAGLLVEHGIIVDEYTQTSDMNIYAAGDCTKHPSAIYDRLICLESVQNANDQARHAAANICGKRKIYNEVPWFWSDQYHIKLQIVGLSQGAEDVIIRGDISLGNNSGFTLFYIKHGVVIAADCISRPKEFMVSKILVREKLRIPTEILVNDSIDPTQFPSYAF